jgi:phosphoribosylformylglycinamidine (FGAM) synthase PurS component
VKFKAKVEVKLKPGLSDAEGMATQESYET